MVGATILLGNVFRTEHCFSLSQTCSSSCIPGPVMDQHCCHLRFLLDLYSNLPSTLAPHLREPVQPAFEAPLLPLLDHCNIHSANTASLPSARPRGNNGECNSARPYGAYAVVKETSKNKETDKTTLWVTYVLSRIQNGAKAKSIRGGRTDFRWLIGLVSSTRPTELCYSCFPAVSQGFL